MNPTSPSGFRRLLREGRIILFDGAMGTQLAERGVEPTPRSNLDAAAVVVRIHRDYREAGADVLITNTFGANPLALARSGEEGRAGEYVARACDLARSALAGGGFLAGDIGPSGAFLEPYGSTPPDRLRQAFETVARALREGGVDLFLVETMSDAREMSLAVEACAAVDPALPVVVSMSFEPVRDGYRTNMGVGVQDAVRAMAATGADAVGTNCGGISPDQVREVIQAFRKETDRPLLAQPNAGLPRLAGDRAVYDLSATDFARSMVEVIRAGARLVGGCCGTGPEHIRALRQALDAAGV